MERLIMSGRDVERTLSRMAHEIVEALQPDKHGFEDVVLVGIWTRGVYLAQRLSRLILKFEGVEPLVGALNIGLNRDDGVKSNIPLDPTTKIPGGTLNRRIVLVDDVLFTTRTVRAAMDALREIGRPGRILLVVLVDRENWELPIRADVVGLIHHTEEGQRINVRLAEVDPADKVDLSEGEGIEPQ